MKRWPSDLFILWLAIFGTGCTAGRTVSRPAAATTQPAAVASAGRAFSVGVCTHFVQRKGLLEENLDMIVAAGATSIRDEVPWGAVEREKDKLIIPDRVDGYVDAARARGLEVMIPLDYGNRFYEGGGKPKAESSIEGFARYAAFVAKHFRGRVRLFEVWNEWDIGIGTAENEKGTPEGYIALLRRAYPAIKQANPNAVVIGGVVTPHALQDGFFERLLDLGLADHCDAISVHTYNYSESEENRTPEAWAAMVGRTVALVKRHGGGKRLPLYVTEHGWPTHYGPGATREPRVAEFLARTLLLARTIGGVAGVWWYDFQDDGWKHAYNEDNFGLVRPDLTPKPAYYALRSVAEAVQSATNVTRVDLGDPAVFVLRLEMPNEVATTYACWRTDQRANPQRSVRLRFTTQDATAKVVLGHAGSTPLARRPLHREWVGKPTSEPEQALSVTLSEMPILISGPADLSPQVFP